MYVYERCLILDQEVVLIWRRKWSLAFAVYLLMHVSMFTVLWSSVATAAVTGCEVRPSRQMKSDETNVPYSRKSRCWYVINWFNDPVLC